VKIYNSNFKGIDSIVMENSAVRAEWIPQYGAKMVSLRLQQVNNQELLYQSPLETLTIPSYAADFASFDTSGFDECFPSIDACQIAVEKEGQTVLCDVPDHGEVWSLPWECVVRDDDSIRFSVTSPTLAYVLTKTVTLSGSELRFDYRVELIGAISQLPFLWTPHLLFGYNAETELVVPSRFDQIKSVCDAGRLEDRVAPYAYPIVAASSIGRWDCSRFLPSDEGTCEKYYFESLLSAGDRFGFKNDGYQVMMSVDSSVAPYLGVWKNQGAHNQTHNFALEPCSGIYDSASQAQDNNTVAYVTKDAPKNWFLTLSCSKP
jgi:galactose mutarotase-like enzyme